MRTVKVSKIPLDEFINVLIEVYNQGAEFVDLMLFPNSKETQDKLSIITRDEYMTGEGQQIIFEPMPSEITSEGDLNDLI